MDSNLNRLCDVCCQIRLELHDSDQCEELGCNYLEVADLRSNESIQGFHSLPHRHYESYRFLEQSALNGCHLCTIFRAGFEQVGKFDNLEAEVSIFWCIEGDLLPRMDFLSEYLTVVCGPKAVAFDVTDVPSSKCVESSGVTTLSDSMSSGSKYLWTGSCIDFTEGRARIRPKIKLPSKNPDSLRYYCPGLVSISRSSTTQSEVKI
jgi:hypothetical protein